MCRTALVFDDLCLIWCMSDRAVFIAIGLTDHMHWPIVHWLSAIVDSLGLGVQMPKKWSLHAFVWLVSLSLL